MNRAPLIALMICVFAIGTTEYVILGILPDVASALGATVPAAGLLVTGYALGVAVGGPVLTIVSGRLPRRGLLLALMGLFIAANLGAALAPGYGALMVSRVASSLAHGTFFAMATVAATELAPLDQRASALALVALGLTLATVVGVPLGTLVGQQWGWRATFVTVACLGLMGLVSLGVLLPPLRHGAALNLAGELSVLGRRQVWLVLAMTVLGFAGVFTSFTYVAPLLSEVSGYSPEAVSILLWLFGVGSVAGTILAGKAADRALMPTVCATLALLAAVLAVFTITSRSRPGAALTLFCFGAAAFATVPPLQTRIITEARGAPAVASAANIAAFNAANAFGAYLGGRVIAAGLPLEVTNLAGALVTLAGLSVALYAAALDRKHRHPQAHEWVTKGKGGSGCE